MVKYQVKVKNQNGEYIGEFDTFKNLTFGKRLNDYGQASFAIPVMSPKAADLLFLRRYTIEIYRNGVLKWAGEQARRISHLTGSGNDWANIINYEWLEQLKKRRTDEELIFTGTDQGEIGLQLINGAFGITEGTIEPTKERDRAYSDDIVYQMLINLTNVIGGMDFEISSYKVYNAYGTKGNVRTDSVIFKYGYNIKEVEIDEDFSNPVNRAIVKGEQTDATDLTRIVRDDEALQGVYEVREDVVTTHEVSEEETFQDKGDAVIRKYGLPLMKIEFTPVGGKAPTIDDFDTGDVITGIIKKGIFDINRPFRVFGWDVSLQDNNAERLSLTLGDFTLT